VTESLRRLVGFTAALRSAGLAVGADRLALAVEALTYVEEIGRDGSYWPLRFAFCLRRDDVPTFDAVYLGWFAGRPAIDPEAAQVTAQPTAGAGIPAGSVAAGLRVDQARGAGDGAELGTRDIARLDADELRRVREWTRMLALAPPMRRTLRRARARSGAIDIGRTVRLMLRNHGELSTIRYRRRATRPRRMLLLIDVSGSMRDYSDVFLHFAYAALSACPRRTEVIAVGTEWQPLTAQLRARHADDAMRAVAAVKADWDGGTTLGVALRGLLRRWGGRSAVRSSLTIIFSDGFEFDDQSQLRRQVHRLSQLAGTLIWVDPFRRTPHEKAPDADLAIAQSYAAFLLPGHNFHALRELAKVIRDA
jgi:uncharacterized protein